MTSLSPVHSHGGDAGRTPTPIAAAEVLNALPEPVLAVDAVGTIIYVNFEAQQFFEASESLLIGRRLDEFLPADSPIHALATGAVADNSSRSEYGVLLETPRIGRHTVTITAAPLTGADGCAVLTLWTASLARKIDNQLTHRGAARSMTAMAAMLAHEVKNPLSGIRGAAQLLEETAQDDDKQLTQLIRDETDRIVALVDRMGSFTETPAEHGPVNIHSVLERVRRLMETGYGKYLKIRESYDPSLPPTHGNYDQLVQVFLNLVKNAAEACVPPTGDILITTRYQRGVSVAVPFSNRRINLPLSVTIQDNGAGIPDDIREHLFDPFVTTKTNGSGLGLALVAKIVDDHGGIIGFESQPRRTVFTVSLPIHVDGPAVGHADHEAGDP
ncbi:MAG: PAS domain-containing protein [Rhodospirillaceae bacterium]|nr:PAS domain-containing protein [Rhodospirillaceae bacterium]MCA8934345.1 PAS domain-containing protein [Rhodospirillaceae bacterium]